MALNKIELENFTVFEKLAVEFCDGINVFIGENGTGKTHLLKIIYSLCEWKSAEPNGTDPTVAQKILECFQHIPFPELARQNSDDSSINIRSTVDGNAIAYRIWGYSKPGTYDCNASGKPNKQLPTIYIPAKEMLTHARLEKDYLFRNLPFDITLIDILNKSGVSTVRNLALDKRMVLDKIVKTIGGKVVYKNDRYYIEKEDGNIIDFAAEAEGFKKLGLIYRLIETGYLADQSILIWDEPEANLNPKLIPFLVDILLALEYAGVQIFVATHDYFFAKYLDVRKNHQHEIRYHALYLNETTVLCEQSPDFECLGNNPIIDQSINLYEEEVKKVME